MHPSSAMASRRRSPGSIGVRSQIVLACGPRKAQWFAEIGVVTFVKVLVGSPNAVTGLLSQMPIALLPQRSSNWPGLMGMGMHCHAGKPVPGMIIALDQVVMGGGFRGTISA